MIGSRAERRWRAEGLLRAEATAVWAFAVRNLQMATRNVFLLFELLFWPVVGVSTIGLMTTSHGFRCQPTIGRTSDV